MMFEAGHPIISLPEWEGFKAWEKSRKEYSTPLFSEVIDREDCRLRWLPASFLPLARGVAIASDALLREAGHRVNRRPRGWQKNYWICGYTLDMRGKTGSSSPDLLGVRSWGNPKLWSIERNYAGGDQVLVYHFGSTPVFTHSFSSAMRLAMHCNADNPPHGLSWVDMAPINCWAAIELAMQRGRDEYLWSLRQTNIRPEATAILATER
jgi:hypothetical protein